MDRHASPHRPTPAGVHLATLALLASFASACGSGKTWAPPPVSVIPVLGVTPGAPAVEIPAAPPSATPSSPAPAGSAAPRAPKPVSGDLPKDLASPLAAHASCDRVGSGCDLGGLYPKSALVDPKSPAAVWTHDLTKAAVSLAIVKHAGVDVYGVVLRGSLFVEGAPGKRSEALGAWKTFRAPGAGISLVANEASTRVLLATTTSGDPLADVAAKIGGKDAAWKERPGPIEIADLATAKDLAWAAGAMHARTAFEGDKQRASLGVLIASPDAPVAQHQHDTSWEILGVLRAAGTTRRAAGPGAGELSPIAVADGAVVAMPKATQHAWVPGNDKPLVAVQIYVPPGPEQRFKQLAAAK